MGRGVENRGSSMRISFEYKGQRCKERIKLKPTPKNIAYAQRLRETILYEIGKGTFDYAAYFPNSPRAVLSGKGHVIKVKQALNEYIQVARKTMAYSTYKDYLSAVNHYLSPQFGDNTLIQLTTSEIKAWISTLEISNKRINNVLIPLRAICQDAYEDGLIDRNPMARIKNLTVDTDEPDPFEPDEVLAILNACKGQEKNLFQYLFWSGLRIGEVIALEWQDIDFRKHVSRVRRSTTRKKTKAPKTKRGYREVELFPPALQAIQQQKPYTLLQGEQVFFNPYTGKPWETDQQIRNAFKKACRRAGVAYKSVKQTRHTFCSTILSLGEDIAWVSQQAGHATPTFTLKVYARWIPKLRPDAGNKVREFLGQNWDKLEGEQGGIRGDKNGK